LLSLGPIASAIAVAGDDPRKVQRKEHRSDVLNAVVAQLQRVSVAYSSGVFSRRFPGGRPKSRTGIAWTRRS
jgi:hypothetical protein